MKTPADTAAAAPARRFFLRACALACAGLATAVLLPARAWAESAAARFGFRKIHKLESAEEAIAGFVGESEVSESEQVVIRAPEIAENGNVVPIEISAEEVDGQVRQLAFFIVNNPRPLNSVFHFDGAEPAVNIRVRMLESTDVIAVARLSSGQCLRNRASVKVTSGGCGG